MVTTGTTLFGAEASKLQQAFDLKDGQWKDIENVKVSLQYRNVEGHSKVIIAIAFQP